MSVFRLFLIKPTHYDDRGYPILWWRSVVPSNSLACVAALAADCRARQVLGPDVSIEIVPIDETNTRVVAADIAERIGGPRQGMVALVGVQSNQFPHAVDLARPLIARGIPVCIGGFHVSGCYSMLKVLPPDILEAQEAGISLYLGEGEGGRLDEVLRDGYAGRLKPVYDHLKDLPAIDGEPGPFLGGGVVQRTIGHSASFDAGRGCPFQCSFCTIINVQGRRSRFRTGADLEKILKANIAEGIIRFFITDDNMARNKNWEDVFDTAIRVQREAGVKFKLTIQVDTLCHKIPGFIDKAAAAGVIHVYIGLENINPDNLIAAKKKQNRITDYREMLLAWKKHPVMISAGYIVGFPYDTKESLLHDIEIVKRELPIDFLFFNYLTPLPGCEDHQKMYERGEWMDPDLNKYDLLHRVTHHPKMTDQEWDEAYDSLWASYYSFDHMVTVLKRVYAVGSNKAWMTMAHLVFVSVFCKGYFKSYRFDWGILPRRYRADRRPSLPRESILAFYSRYFFDLALFASSFALTWTRLRLVLWRIRRDKGRGRYRDPALEPPAGSDYETLELFTTRGAKESVGKARARAAALAG